jgi:uncharacterized circularly permuted ATP-grasp superfamily protein
VGSGAARRPAGPAEELRDDGDGVVAVHEAVTGVADDKLAHAYVEDMIRFYLGEEPSVRSVQTLVHLSTHPTLIDGELAPRHVDLRPFVFMHGPDRPRVMPGGLTRYAVEEGAVMVNPTQNGGFKDTWVLGR